MLLKMALSVDRDGGSPSHSGCHDRQGDSGLVPMLWEIQRQVR